MWDPIITHPPLPPPPQKKYMWFLPSQNTKSHNMGLYLLINFAASLQHDNMLQFLHTERVPDKSEPDLLIR